MLLQQFIRTTRAELDIPRVVLEEAKNLFREELGKGAVELSKLGRLLPDESQLLPKLDVESKVRDYERRLLQHLGQNFKSRILDFPAISHQNVVKRDLERRRPFSKSGKGYRDALIWYSILDAVKSVKDEFVFITDNTSDFWDEPAKDLHHELRADLSELGGIVGPFTLFRTLAAFNDQVVKPKLEKIVQLLYQLNADKFPSLSVKKLAQEYSAEVKEELSLRNALQEIRWRYGVSVNGASVVDFGHISFESEVDVLEVLEMPDKNLFIRFNAEYEVTAVVDVPAEEAEKWEDSGISLDSEWGHGDALMSADLQVRGEFSLIYDPESHKVNSHKVSAEFV